MSTPGDSRVQTLGSLQSLSLKQKLDSVKEHLIVCAQCVIFWIDFSTARKEIFIVQTPLAGWKFQNLTHIFRDHSLLAKFWILFPLNLWNQQWAHWLTDNKILSWSYPPCLQVEVWAELWNNKFWVSTLSQTWFLSKKIPWPQILRQKNYAQKHVFRDIF